MRAGVIELPEPAVAAAAAGSSVWCVAADRLLSFDAGGGRRWEVDAPEGVTSLAAADVLVASLEPGIVSWLDPETGAELARRPVGGDPVVVAGGGGVWVFDRASGRAWSATAGASLSAPLDVPGASWVVPEGGRLWWLSDDGSALGVDGRRVELGPPRRTTGRPVACAGSIWIGSGGRLGRVSAWSAEAGPPLPVPGNAVGTLCCADGTLVLDVDGALYVLDPSRDADLRPLNVKVEGGVGALVSAISVVWAFSEELPHAYLASVHPGG